MICVGVDQIIIETSLGARTDIAPNV